MQRTSQIVLISFLVFIGIAACTAYETGFATSSGACGNALYPVKQGAAWTYASTGGPNGSFIYTDTVTEVRADGFTLTSQIADSLRSQKWSCQSGGLQALQVGGSNAAGITTQGIIADFTALDISGISLPEKISHGMQWQYALKLKGTMATPDNAQSLSSGSYSVTMRELGKETITVPAGTFEAVKIQANAVVDVTTSFAGIPIPVKYNGVSIIWYAPEVGYIKSVENGDFSGTAFSVTTELQNYNIP